LRMSHMSLVRSPLASPSLSTLPQSQINIETAA
jgi:hypothetical protein